MQRLKLRSFWEEAKKTEVFQRILADLLKNYQFCKNNSPSALPTELRNIYKETGSRIEFEKEYFQKRNFIVNLALLALIFPGEDEYIKGLKVYLRSVCEEYSWALPAHCTDAKDETKVVDLFASETVCMLAEISVLLEKELGEETVRFIRGECEKRVFEPYSNETFWWETGWNNWTSVCCGHIGIAMMRIAPERFEKEKERMLRSMALYINSFPDDGNCLEGLTYWHYGFGSWVWFADEICRYTDGREDLFVNAKVEKIASYAQKMFLKGDVSVSVADSSIFGKGDPTLFNFLHKKYPKSCRLITKDQSKYCRGNVAWLPVTRLLFYGLRAEYVRNTLVKDYYFENAGQVILNRKKYSLFVKAGHNDESHNHNDVGSFILSTDRGQIFCDLGSATYFGGYFDPDIRYTLLNVSSRGHSVPIVDREYQKSGKEYGGRMTYKENHIVVDFADAYGGKAEKLIRSFSCENSALELIDEFSGCRELTERFVTLFRPEILENGVKIANVILSCKDSVPQIHEVIDEKYFVGNPQTVYLIDYDFVNKTKAAFRMEITEK